MYVADHGNRRIQKFSLNGTFLTQWDSEYLWDLHIDSKDILYAVDYDNNLIGRFTLNGTMLLTWNGAESGDSESSQVYGITTDSNGMVYVADQYGNAVKVYTAEGEFVRKFSTAEVMPRHITLYSKGNVYVTSRTRTSGVT